MQQVVIGSRSTELLKEIDSSGLSDFDFGFEELEDEDSETDISDDGNSSTYTDEGEGVWLFLRYLMSEIKVGVSRYHNFFIGCRIGLLF